MYEMKGKVLRGEREREMCHAASYGSDMRRQSRLFKANHIWLVM